MTTVPFLEGRPAVPGICFRYNINFVPHLLNLSGQQKVEIWAECP